MGLSGSPKGRLMLLIVDSHSVLPEIVIALLAEHRNQEVFYIIIELLMKYPG